MQAKIGKDKHKSHTVAEAIKAVTKTELKAIYIMIPKKLHTDFKTKITSNNSNMKEALLKMINSYIEI